MVKLLQKYLENVLIVIVLLLTTKTYKIKIIKKFKNFIALVIATISFAILIATNWPIKKEEGVALNNSSDKRQIMLSKINKKIAKYEIYVNINLLVINN